MSFERGKRSISLNLKTESGRRILRKLIDKADVLIDPFRPGVLESLGLSPRSLHETNPKLIIARLTGYGQTGKYSSFAGHDINYIALSGALSLIGPSEKPPTFPANLLGDFAGGAALCVIGILMALLERQNSGKGQVIDAAMIDGALYLSTFIIKMKEQGLWNEPRGQNMLDGGAPFYQVYETLDKKYMSVGSIEPQFYQQMSHGLGLTSKEAQLSPYDPSHWPTLTRLFQEKFKTKTRQEWTLIFEELKDACVAPVLEIHEVMSHEHHQTRQTLVQGNPQPCPRLERTPGQMSLEKRTLPAGGHTKEILMEMGYSFSEIEGLVKDKIIRDRSSKL